jgi:hypothetical protein
MKFAIRNIIIFILLIVGTYFLYQIKEGLTNEVETLDISSGYIPNTHKYSEPECDNDEFLYCTGDKIVCEDIFGNPINDMMIEKSNSNIKTYSGCGSGLNPKTYKQFLEDMSNVLMLEGKGVYDISNCPYEKPWRVDISSGDISFNYRNDLSDVYIKDDYYKCYKNPSSSVVSNLDRDTNLYIDSIVYVDGDYLYDTYKDQELFKVIRAQTRLWVNNKVCYKGVIKDITENNTFNVYIPDYEGQVFNDIKRKYLYTINLEYSESLNKTLTDLNVGSFPRPVCKNGNFTNKCSKSYDIQPPDKIDDIYRFIE